MNDVSRNVVSVTIVVSLGATFLFGYNLAVLNQASFLIREFYNETYTRRRGAGVDGNETMSIEAITALWSFTSAVYIPGGIVGALLAGHLADRIGRIRTVLVSLIFTAVGAFCGTVCVIAGSPELLLIGRFVVGIQFGIGACIAPIVVAEISTPSIRGLLQGFGYSAIGTFGLFVSGVLGLPTLLSAGNRWPYLHLVELAPALLAVCVLPFVPETPHHIQMRFENSAVTAGSGESDEIRRELVHSLRFYRRSSGVACEFTTISIADREKRPAVQEHVTIIQLLRNKSLRRPLVIACTLQV